MTSEVLPEDLRRRLSGIPYQRVKDTPTVSYYTKWGAFEEKLYLSKARNYPRNLLPELVPGEIHAVLDSTGRTLGRVPGVILRGVAPEDLEGVENLIGLKPFEKLPEESKLMALHKLRWFAGLMIHGFPSRIVKEPVVIASLGGDGYVGHHILVKTGYSNELTVVVVDLAHGVNGLKTLVLEGEVGDFSRLNLVTVSVHGIDTPVFFLKNLEVGSKATLNISSIVLGGEMTHFREDTILRGEFSELRSVVGAVTLRSKADVITNVIHLGRRSVSDIKFRGVSLREGYLVHRGVARVTPEARVSSTSIESRVATLSKDSKGYSVPMLELQTGDIEMGRHSAAVVSLAEEQMFYLRSRGLSEEDITAITVVSTMESAKVSKYGINSDALIKSISYFNDV